MQDAETSRQPAKSLSDRVKTNCLSMAVTCQEGFSYVKAFFVGQVRIQESCFEPLKQADQRLMGLLESMIT